MEASKVEIDVPTCWERLVRLKDAWKKPAEDSIWKKQPMDAVVVSCGQPQEEVMYLKSSSVHIWLFGYEFSDTILVFCPETLYILSSSKKVNILRPIATSAENGAAPPMKIEFLVRGSEDHFGTLMEAMKGDKEGAIVGTLLKETAEGSFVESWSSALKESGLELVDAAPAFAELFSIKDAKELKCIKTAAVISSHVLKARLIPRIETVIDEGLKITHSKLSEEVEKAFEKPEELISKKLNPDAIDSCYTPSIQSGGVYNLRPGAQSTEELLHFGTIITALGGRFKSYCSNVARTFFVDPTKEQEVNYRLVIDMQEAILKFMKPGTKLKDVYNRAVKHLEKNKPDLVGHLLKHCGFGIGIEFQESMYTINAKNEHELKAGMVFNLTIGLQDLENRNTDDPKKKKYSILISDTVAITPSGEADVLTKTCSKKYSEVAYFINEEEEEPQKAKPAQQKKPSPKAPSKPKLASAKEANQIVATKLRESTVQRAEEKNKLKSVDDKRKEHQKVLEEQRLKEAQEKYAKKKKKKEDDDQKGKKQKKIVAFKSPAEFPHEASRNKIFVDAQRESILVPIYGILVPFHISTVKNISKTEDDYLRINFITPESTMMISSQKKPESLVEPKAIRIKELTFHSSDTRSLNNTLRMIREIRKRITSRETEKMNLNDIVEQEKLVISKGRNPRLSDIFIRPNPTGRRTIGTLEAHTNGFRFSPMKGGFIDILYKNIKHAFFQPAEKDLLVLIHFHLHNAIMLGKKKTLDVQFCTEVMEVSQALDGRRHEDEMEDEQRERAMKIRLNNDFQTFYKKLEESTDLEFDTPYADLGFFGVPNRSNVFLVPTVNCLVNLSEQPFFILTLADVEIAYFERVQFSLKNFDLVFVFKDYDKPVAHVNSISVEYLETIKEWLDSCDIKYYEGTQTLNWNRIMGVIKMDPQKFHTEEGGWTFLNAESEGEEDESDEESSEFEPDAEEATGEVGEEEDEDEEEYSEEPEDSDMSEEEGESEEGEDWDALEEKAQREDRDQATERKKRGRDGFDSDEERRAKKRK